MKRVVNIKRIVFAVAVLWLLFIWSNSFRTADESSQASLNVLYWFAPLLNRLGLPEEHCHILLRKLAHLVEFALAGVLWGVALSPMIDSMFRIRYLRWAMAFSICLLAAVIDESIQCYIPGRSSELRDVFIDLLGATFGILVSIVISYVCRKKMKNKE